VILPWANRRDVEHDVAKEIRGHIQFAFARSVREVLDAAFGPGSLPWHAPAGEHPLVKSMFRLEDGRVVEKQRV
jgi:ATP-dependent Lon protease